MFFKQDIFNNFAIFTEKHLCLSLFFDKTAQLKVCNFITDYVILLHNLITCVDYFIT